MNFSPYSLGHAPRALPIWQSIIEDLGNPHPRAVARVLGVGTRTVYRWHRDGRAPRAACLALFWLTRWGRSLVDADAVRSCQLAVAYANALERERDQLAADLRRLHARLEHVLSLADTGAANEPVILEGAPHVG